jgi:hypothetical protein
MRRRLGQLLWFAGLWVSGVAAVAIVAYGIRWWLSTT